MKFRSPSDLFFWLLLIFPAFGAIVSVLNLQALGVVLLIGGFALMECGRAPGVKLSQVVVRYVGCCACATIVYLLIGSQLMYGGRMFEELYGPLSRRSPAIVAVDSFSAGDFAPLHWRHVPIWSQLRFQSVFCATTALLVCAALGRVVRPMMQFIVCGVLGGLIYPLLGQWTWGGGWLAKTGFFDYAGGTLVFSVAAWAALPLLWACRGSSSEGPSRDEGFANRTNIALYLTGAALVWLSLAGLGLLSLFFEPHGSTSDVTLMFAVLSSAIAARIFADRDSCSSLAWPMVGCLAAIAALSACVEFPDHSSRDPLEGLAIGAVAGALAMLMCRIFRRLSIPDRLQIIPACGAGGVWGTLCAGLFGTSPGTPPSITSSRVQLIGIICTLIWAGGVFAVIAEIARWRGWLKQESAT